MTVEDIKTDRLRVDGIQERRKKIGQKRNYKLFSIRLSRIGLWGWVRLKMKRLEEKCMEMYPRSTGSGN